MLKNESKSIGEIVSRNSRTNLPSFCISQFICIFVSSSYYLKQRNESHKAISIHEGRKQVIAVTRVAHVVSELMKNVSKSTSYTWQVFEIDESFLKPGEILRSTRVSFECNSRRQEVTRPAMDGTAFP